MGAADGGGTGPPRVAVTVEQCWHAVPGGTATSVLRTVDAVRARGDVDQVGLAARHRDPAPSAFVPGIPVRHHAVPRRVLYQLWQRLRLPKAESATGPVDVVHATTFAVPGHRAPLVVTVHDLAFLHEPGHFTAHGVRFFSRGLQITRDEAALVLVPSRATERDCLDAGIDGARLRLVPHGVAVDRPSEDDVRGFAQRHGLTRPYILWCGTVEPRKNVPRLLAAFAAMARTDPLLDLVLVGPPGWGQVDLTPPPGTRDRIRLLGFLSEHDLGCAYAGAAAFCYPSLREGFGLPVLEAMAHGVPVVTSRGTAMAEFVAEGSGLLVDPTDTDEIAEALSRATGPERGNLSCGALAAASDRTWERTAALTVSAYREAAGLR